MWLNAHAVIRRRHFCICILAGIALYAQVPKLSFSDPAAPPFIVRLERNHSGKSVCGIVRGDGLFHVESKGGSHVEISEGNLDDMELASLKAELANKDLAVLTQQMIPVPLAITEQDEVLISILRSPLTQNLTFLGRESRRPFDAFIDPLVHWFEALRQHPHTSLTEFSGRNNCLPPRKLDFSPRRNPVGTPDSPATPETGDAKVSTSGTSPPAPRSSAFLLRWDFNHIAGGVVEDTCVVIYPSGHYRMERSTQEFHEKLKLRAYEETLDDSDLRELIGLLNEPELKSSTHRNTPNGQVFREGELTTVAISRDQQIQQLAFANYFAVPGWVSNMGSSTDPEERLVKPLRKWLKTHIEGRKTTPVPNPIPTRCFAQPVAQTADKRP